MSDIHSADVQMIAQRIQTLSTREREMLFQILGASDRADSVSTRLSKEAIGYATAGFLTLTPREKEVFNLVTTGLSNKHAALELGISPRTVEIHRLRVMSKLGARNIVDLCHFAAALGMGLPR